jgi:class 3 adenylate cyclase/TolB-like protein
MNMARSSSGCYDASAQGRLLIVPAVSKEVIRRRLAAILFADVAGSSHAMGKDEENTVGWIRRSIEFIRSLIGDYGGRVIHTAGDGIVATFDSAREALNFALEFQRELRNEVVWNITKDRLAFRIGINLGDVIDMSDDIYGQSVNIAARIQAFALPGGICISAATREAVSGWPDLQLRSLGCHVLKNISDPVEIFAVEMPPGPAAKFVGPSDLLPAPLPHVSSEASVAVLPLRNLSGDPSDEHLCAGTTGDIISNLCRFRQLLVIARHSAFLFHGSSHPSPEIAQRLGVRYLITGGLQRVGTRLRIRVELSEAEAERVIWAEHYHGDLADLFAFQDDVANTAAARLAIEISTSELRRMREAPDLNAYGLVLRGQDLSLRFRKEANLHARRLFERAAECDPEYGRVYAGISRTFNLAWRYRWADDPKVCLDHAVDLALGAVERDQLDARGYAELGFAQLYKKEHDAALAAYEQAIELNPNDADILAEMGDALTYAGHSNRAVRLINRAMRLNPYCPDWYHWYLGEAHFHLGHYKATIATLGKMRDPSEAHRLLAASHALLGEMDQARYHADRVMAIHPNFSVEHWRTVPPDKYVAPLEVFIEGLRRAGLK